MSGTREWILPDPGALCADNDNETGDNTRDNTGSRPRECQQPKNQAHDCRSHEPDHIGSQPTSQLHRRGSHNKVGQDATDRKRGELRVADKACVAASHLEYLASPEFPYRV